MEYCNHGIVIDKQIISGGKRRKTKYYITVSYNENQFRENAPAEYSSINIGDEVIIFTVHGKKRIYFAKKD